MIVGFAEKKTETFYRGGRVAAFSGFARAASRKLDQLDAAIGLRDLSRPGNRLESLKGRRKGQWSIRINDQWADLFRMAGGKPRPGQRGNRRLPSVRRHVMMRDPIHPGETLREDLDALEMSAAELARRV